MYGSIPHCQNNHVARRQRIILPVKEDEIFIR